jgi:hypothetical protein
VHRAELRKADRERAEVQVAARHKAVARVAAAGVEDLRLGWANRAHPLRNAGVWRVSTAFAATRNATDCAPRASRARPEGSTALALRFSPELIRAMNAMPLHCAVRERVTDRARAGSHRPEQSAARPQARATSPKYATVSSTHAPSTRSSAAILHAERQRARATLKSRAMASLESVRRMQCSLQRKHARDINAPESRVNALSTARTKPRAPVISRASAGSVFLVGAFLRRA